MTIQPDGAVTTLPTGTITDQVFSPDGQTLYTARNGTITAYDISTGNGTGSWTNGDGRSDIAWRQDNGQLNIWQATSDNGFVAGFSTLVSNQWHVQDPFL